MCMPDVVVIIAQRPATNKPHRARQNPANAFDDTSPAQYNQPAVPWIVRQPACGVMIGFSPMPPARGR